MNKIVLKSIIFAAIFLHNTAAWSQNSHNDELKRNINEALDSGDCDRAQRNYDVLKVAQQDKNIETRIKKCRDQSTQQNSVATRGQTTQAKQPTSQQVEQVRRQAEQAEQQEQFRLFRNGQKPDYVLFLDNVNNEIFYVFSDGEIWVIIKNTNNSFKMGNTESPKYKNWNGRIWAFSFTRPIGNNRYRTYTVSTNGEVWAETNNGFLQVGYVKSVDY